MENSTPNKTEDKQFLVLGDEEGNYYHALPVALVEQHKATGEQLERISR